LPSLAEIDRLFVEYDSKQLESEFGLTLSSHAIDYLLSPSGKERRAEPEFLKKTWPQLVQNLRAVKAKFIAQGLTSESFNTNLNVFLTGSAYANSQEAKWLVFDSKNLMEKSLWIAS
jgi:hypothetical protein